MGEKVKKFETIFAKYIGVKYALMVNSGSSANLLALSILSNPKNALVKQYQKLFDMENVHLEFTTQALKEVVKIAKTQKTGARALRSILENTMLDIMYEIPSHSDILEVVISEEVINRGERPLVVYQDEPAKEAS